MLKGMQKVTLRCKQKEKEKSRIEAASRSWPSEAFVASATHLDLLDPLGEEDLVGSESACGIGIQD
jgi:hypothetical protein